MIFFRMSFFITIYRMEKLKNKRLKPLFLLLARVLSPHFTIFATFSRP